MARRESTELHLPDWDDYRETRVQFDVLTYLQKTGWEIKKQTFYNHCSSGRLKKNRAGVYSRRAVKKYAEDNLIHSSVGMPADDAALNLVAVKTQKEIKRLDIGIKREELKFSIEKKLYVLKSDMAAELAARAVVLDNGLEYMFQTCLAEMIEIVGGDQSRSTELLEYLQEKKDRQMNEFATMDNFLVELVVDGPNEFFADGDDESDYGVDGE